MLLLWLLQRYFVASSFLYWSSRYSSSSRGSSSSDYYIIATTATSLDHSIKCFVDRSIHQNRPNHFYRTGGISQKVLQRQQPQHHRLPWSSSSVLAPTTSTETHLSSSYSSTSIVTSFLQWRGGSTSSTSLMAVTSNKEADHVKGKILDYNASHIDAGAVTMEKLWEILRSSPQGLILEEDIDHRIEQYGYNTLEKPPSKSILKLILEQFQDRLVQILLIVAIISAIFSVAEVTTASGVVTDIDTATTSTAIWKSFVEPIVIVSILILNAIVGVWQSRSASDSLAALEQMQAAMCNVQRRRRKDDEQSQSYVIPAELLVPGDIIEIRTGDKIPADGRLISITSSVLTVDEGPLTGESIAVFKLPGDEGTVNISSSSSATTTISEQRGMVYAGTCVTQGSGRVVITQTGMDTQFGQIQRGVLQAKLEQPKTPLQIKLDEFGEMLTGIIFIICVAVWVVSIPKMNDQSFSSVWDGAVYYAKVSVALGVAAIPEGLPAVITLCLSLGTRRMAQRNVIVRNLPSVETLGCTSVICTDKTGTLTTNEMTVVSLIILEQSNGVTNITEHTVNGISYSPMGSVDGIVSTDELKQYPSGAVSDVAAVCALCNDAIIIGNDSNTTTSGNHVESETRTGKGENSSNEKVYERVGEPTEAALCVLAEKIGGMSNYFHDGHVDRGGLHFDIPPSILASSNVKSWRELHPRVATLEFNRDRKSMSVLCNYQNQLKSRQRGNRLLVKGAPNLLIERCTHVKYRDGKVVKLTGRLRRDITETVAKMAARPLRCLALAVKDSNNLEKSLKHFAPIDERDIARHPLLSDASTYANIESGLTLVGIVGIKDPARPGVGDSIDLCSKAGIRVMMITGDAKDTAVAIAREINIFPSDTKSDDHEHPLKAFDGRDFFSKPHDEQLEILRKDNIVFCRTEPADKQKLIKMLQSLGEVTCMTGDGVNDAPALQQASIGVAMGITGTEVSKEAADMILADDNFSTIVAAVEEGRRIYNNMQAFICFLISCNIGEICTIFLATVAGFPEPLTAMHLLWVNLVTDGPPATALGFNPPAPDLMDSPPRPSNEPIMTRWLLLRYCITGLYVGLATIGVFVQYYVSQGLSVSQLASWSQCGDSWSPTGELSCSELFQGSGRSMPQTMALTTLVAMEMIKALSAVSVDTSILRIGPQNNKWLLIGVSIPTLLHLFVLYSSKFGFGALGESFGMVPLSRGDWVMVLAWALPILLVDEVLKAIGRYLYRSSSEKATFDR